MHDDALEGSQTMMDRSNLGDRKDAVEGRTRVRIPLHASATADNPFRWEQFCAEVAWALNSHRKPDLGGQLAEPGIGALVRRDS